MNKSQFKKLYILCNISLLGAALISGLSFVAQKIGMTYTGPFTFNTLRCAIGSLSILPLIYFFRNSADLNKINSSKTLLFKGAFIAGCVLFVAFSINQYCMIYAPASKAGFITSLYVIFVPVIAVFMKHKMLMNVKISILLALLGLYLLCSKGSLSFEPWDILLLLSAFFFCIAYNCCKSLLQKSQRTCAFLPAVCLCLHFIGSVYVYSGNSGACKYSCGLEADFVYRGRGDGSSLYFTDFRAQSHTPGSCNFNIEQ